MRQFVFDGKSSSDYGVFLDSTSIFGTPERDIEEVSIPGRNGTLTIDNKRFKNIDIPYNCYITKDAPVRFKALQDFLLKNIEYRRLEDTADANHFRMAKISSKNDFNLISQHFKQGTFPIIFNCMPQNFLKSGEAIIAFNKNGELINQTYFEASPLIRIYGKGVLTIGNGSIEILKEGNEYIDIDCENHNAYENDQYRNDCISVSYKGKKHAYPILEPGSNVVTFTGITKIEIKPRWWEL